MRFLVTVLFVTCALAAPARAQGVPAPPPPPAPPDAPLTPAGIAALADELGLEPGQRQAIRDIDDDARKQQAKLGAEIETVEIDLRRELDRDAPDEAKVAGYIDRITTIEASMRKT